MFLLLVFGGCQNFSDDTGFDVPKPEFSFEGSSVECGKTGGEYTLKVKSNLPWRIASSEDWVKVSPSHGDGDATVTMTVTANRTFDPRTAEISAYIVREDVTTITVTQEAANPLDFMNTYHVTVYGSPENDGLSWDKPMTLDAALAAAGNGETILVAAGTYIPTRNLSGTTSQNAVTFEIHSNVNLYGGYPERPDAGSVADPEKNETILSGGDRCTHVVAITAPKMTGRFVYDVNIDGFTITKGSANTGTATSVTIGNAKFNDTFGTGLIVGNTKATITNCRITGNTHRQGAVRVDYGADITFRNCVISDNPQCALNANCGGVWVESCDFCHFDNCVFEKAVSKGVAGALYVVSTTKVTTSLLLTNCVIHDNQITGTTTASWPGGGIYVREYGKVVIVNTTFDGNVAPQGAGITCYGTAAGPSETWIISSTISNNTNYVLSGGAGVRQANAYGKLHIYNSLVSGNKAKGVVEDVKFTGNDYDFRNSIFGNTVYGADGQAVSGASFVHENMLDAFGSVDGTYGCRLIGSDNPARSYGMSVQELEKVVSELDARFQNAISVAIDQTGSERKDRDIGAIVK